MIVPMRRIDILCSPKDADNLLAEVQELSVLHPDAPRASVPEDVKAKIERCQRALAILEAYSVGGTPVTLPADEDVDSYLADIEDAQAALERADVDLAGIDRKEEEAVRWGDVDPEVAEALRERGVFLRFYRIAHKDLSALTQACPETQTPVQLGLEGNSLRLAVVGRGEEAELFETLGYRPEVVEPGTEESRRAAREEALRRRADCEARLRTCAESREVLTDLRDRLLDEAAFFLARSGVASEAEGAFLRLGGYAPEGAGDSLQKKLADTGHPHVFVERKVGHDDKDVPVALRNGPITRLFEPITRIFSLPAYTEFDPTVFLAPFFAFYVGLCEADLGYGLLILLVALVALFRTPKGPMREIIKLVVVLAAVMSAVGLALDVFFGLRVSEELVREYHVLPPFFDSLVVFREGQDDQLMIFAIICGFVQVMFGVGLRAFHHARTHGFAHGLHSFGHVLIIAAAAVAGGTMLPPDQMIGPFALGTALHAIPDPFGLAAWLGGAGVFFVLFFTDMGVPVFLRPGKGLWALYEIATGLLSDILSYLRLFALGLASGLLALAINNIALTVLGEPASVGGFVGMAAILIIGHGINLGLSLLGSFVHPIRLTFVEFYKAIGFQGGGLPYSALRRTAKQRT